MENVLKSSILLDGDWQKNILSMSESCECNTLTQEVKMSSPQTKLPSPKPISPAEFMVSVFIPR